MIHISIFLPIFFPQIKFFIFFIYTYIAFKYLIDVKIKPVIFLIFLFFACTSSLFFLIGYYDLFVAVSLCLFFYLIFSKFGIVFISKAYFYTISSIFFVTISCLTYLGDKDLTVGLVGFNRPALAMMYIYIIFLHIINQEGRLTFKNSAILFLTGLSLALFSLEFGGRVTLFVSFLVMLSSFRFKLMFFIIIAAALSWIYGVFNFSDFAIYISEDESRFILWNEVFENWSPFGSPTSDLNSSSLLLELNANSHNLLVHLIFRYGIFGLLIALVAMLGIFYLFFTALQRLDFRILMFCAIIVLKVFTDSVFLSHELVILFLLFYVIYTDAKKSYFLIKRHG